MAAELAAEAEVWAAMDAAVLYFEVEGVAVVADPESVAGGSISACACSIWYCSCVNNHRYKTQIKIP